MPLEGTRMDLFNSIIPAWYAEQLNPYTGNADLAARVWVTAVCQDLNASQIAAMPLKWHGPPGVGRSPARPELPAPFRGAGLRPGQAERVGAVREPPVHRMLR